MELGLTLFHFPLAAWAGNVSLNMQRIQFMGKRHSLTSTAIVMARPAAKSGIPPIKKWCYWGTICQKWGAIRRGTSFSTIICHVFASYLSGKWHLSWDIQALYRRGVARIGQSKLKDAREDMKMVPFFGEGKFEKVDWNWFPKIFMFHIPFKIFFCKEANGLSIQILWAPMALCFSGSLSFV